MKKKSDTFGQNSTAAITNEEHTISASLLQRAFDNSLVANIISTLDNDRVIRANRTACKLLGYSRKHLLMMKRADIFKVSESSYKQMLQQRKEKGGAKADLFILRRNGVLWPCEITSVLFKDKDGVNYSITSFVDRRERMSAQRKLDVENKRATQLLSDDLLSENNDWILSISKSSYDVIWDWDIVTDLVSFGKNYEKVFGHKLTGEKISFAKWITLVIPKERRGMKIRLNKIFRSRKHVWNDTFQFVCPDGSISQVISRANIIRDDQAKAIRMIGVMHDLSKMHKLEGQLEQEVRRNEKGLVDAVEVAKEMQRADIGRELHDNVNQLLGASMLYLNMAQEDIKNGDIYLRHSSEYTLTAIEAIRKLTKGLITDTIDDFGLSETIEDMVRDMMESNQAKIHFLSVSDSLEDLMDNKFKLNVFRILQEQTRNIIKHAAASEINISIVKSGSQIILTVADNGVGFDSSKKPAGIGMTNIISRAKTYNGNASFISKPGQGCKLLVTFPVPK
jgi:PAS domain S-box-containing protein